MTIQTIDPCECGALEVRISGFDYICNNCNETRWFG